MEHANSYFDQALKTWRALWKGNSKSIWHGKHWEELTPEQRKLVLPMMKNYIEKYAPSGEFDKSKVGLAKDTDMAEDEAEILEVGDDSDDEGKADDMDTDVDLRANA